MRMFDSVYCTDNENDFLTVFIALIMTMFDSVDWTEYENVWQCILKWIWECLSVFIALNMRMFVSVYCTEYENVWQNYFTVYENV